MDRTQMTAFAAVPLALSGALAELASLLNGQPSLRLAASFVPTLKVRR